MKKLIYLTLILAILTGCTKASEDAKKTSFLLPVSDANGDMQLLLNTEIKLMTLEKDDEEELLRILNDTVAHYHYLLDAHHYYEDDKGLINNLKVINDAYGSEEKIDVDEDLRKALEESFVLAELSEGYFNPTVGALSELWSDKFSEGELYNSDPSEDAVEKACNCVIPYTELRSYIEIDDEDGTVIFHVYEKCKDRVIIDLGGFAKGYVLDIAAEKLKTLNRSFLIDGGSSSIVAYSPADSTTEWTIGVRSPKSGDVLYAIKESNISLSTSGDDERYFLLKDSDDIIRRHHIIDPYTGYSANYYRDITLIAKGKAGVLDALSTALFSIEDRAVQKRIVTNISEHYDLKVESCLIKEEDGGLKLLIDSDFDKRLLSDVLSNELRGKEISE